LKGQPGVLELLLTKRRLQTNREGMYRLLFFLQRPQLIHKLPADYPIFRGKSGRGADITGTTEFDQQRSSEGIHATCLLKRGIIPPLHE
jgi:hypothetical protein